MPATPCSAKVSMESSTWTMYLILVAKLQIVQATIPRMTEAHRGMTPDAGVAATRPEMIPEQTATVDHFLSSLKSSRHQVMAPKMAVRLELKIE